MDLEIRFPAEASGQTTQPGTIPEYAGPYQGPNPLVAERPEKDFGPYTPGVTHGDTNVDHSL